MNIDSKRSAFGLFGRIMAGMTLAAGMLLTSCRQPVETVRPVFQGIYSPKAFQMTFGNRTAGNKVDFNIDNINMRIYNETPLPYGTVLDSAYLTMYLSNQMPMTILNVETGKQKWTPGDSAKISVKGGRLTLNINRDKHEPLSYDIRILSYGYDPNKLTWQNLGSGILSKAFDESTVYNVGSDYYYLGRAGAEASLYRISFDPFGLGAVSDAVLPPGLRPETLLKDNRGNAWAVTDDGAVYFTADQKKWTAFYIPGEDKVISLLNDNTKAGTQELSLSVITQVGGEYYFRNMIGTAKGAFETFRNRISVPVSFPISDSYIYTYTVSGTQHSNIFGGLTRGGLPSEKSYFTSDGLRWAETPYASVAKSVPEIGGLYLADPNTPGRIILVGGIYDGKVSSAIQVSADRGITWTELTKEQLPPKEFLPRSNASGLLMRDSKGLEHVYILGGEVSGTPSKEVWHGFLDTKGGIVNAFED